MAFIDNGKSSHLDRLAHDPIRERRTPQGKYYTPAACSYIAMIGHLLHNKVHMKPLYTGVHKYAMLGVAGVAIGLWIDDYLLRVQQKKYARIIHYLELHPEDFPPYPPRLKIADTLATWYPKRPGW